MEIKNARTTAIVSSLVGLLVLVISDSISFATKLRFSIFIVVVILSPCFITNEKRSAIPKEQSTKRTVGIFESIKTKCLFVSKSIFLILTLTIFGIAYRIG
jgi:hypothetical protein